MIGKDKAEAKPIWYVAHPVGQYREDVKALARENGLVIIDARFDIGNGAQNVPKLTKKSAKAVAADKKAAE